MSKRIEKLIERNKNVIEKAEAKVMDNNNKMVDKIISEVFSKVEELKMLNAVDRLEEALKLNIEAVKTNTVEVPVVRILKEVKKPEVIVVEKERPVVRVFRDKTPIKEVERIVYTTFRKAKEEVKAKENKSEVKTTIKKDKVVSNKEDKVVVVKEDKVVKEENKSEVKAAIKEDKVVSKSKETIVREENKSEAKKVVETVNKNKYIEPLTIEGKTYRVVSSFENKEYIAGVIRVNKTDIRFQASKIMDALTIFDSRYVKQEDAIRQLLIKNKMIRLNVPKLDEYKYQNSKGSCHFHINNIGEHMYQGYININNTKYLYKYSYEKDAVASIAFAKLNDWFAKQGKIKFYPYASKSFVNPVHELINERAKFAKKAKEEKTKELNAELLKEFGGLKKTNSVANTPITIANTTNTVDTTPITVTNTDKLVDTTTNTVTTPNSVANTDTHDNIAVQRVNDFLNGSFGLSEQEEQEVLDCGF